jgi:tetratricopeptide (TPR) repeat protein
MGMSLVSNQAKRHPRKGGDPSVLLAFLQPKWIPAFAGMAMLLVFLLLSNAVYADTPPVIESPQLQKCLKRADEFPDIAAAEAAVWIKKNGGDEAHLCRAFAQANRGMHEDAAREFWALASTYEKQNLNRALLMHNFAGQEFLIAKDIKNADAQYAAVLKIAPNDATGLIGRAKTRMEAERYWEAIDDLNRVLKVNPDDIDALRQRGRAWTHLDNANNAQEDFARAGQLAGDQTGK